MTHIFKKGDTVTVINRTVAAGFFVEGTAKIVEPVAGDNYYLVDFGDEYGPTSRYVDPDGQEDPAGYASYLNEGNA